MGEHLVVGAALRQFGDADAHDPRRRLERQLGNGGREHLALAAMQVMIVERHD